MNVKSFGFVSVILTGYIGISFGVLKIFWRQFGVHFYAPGIEHLPKAGLMLDSTLILVVIVSGMCLVVVRAVVPALVFLICSFFIEFLFLHEGHHGLWHNAFVVGAITGQIISLTTYLVGYSVFGKIFAGIRYRIPPQDV